MTNFDSIDFDLTVYLWIFTNKKKSPLAETLLF